MTWKQDTTETMFVEFKNTDVRVRVVFHPTSFQEFEENFPLRCILDYRSRDSSNHWV